jgi:uncharacterized protein (TIGR03067 family)
MMKLRATCFVALVLTCGVSGAFADEDAAQTDQARLTGVWSFSLVKFNGQTRPEIPFPGNKMIISRDGRYVVVQGTRITRGSVKVDPTKTPKHYDFVVTSGPRKGLTAPGIYELAGDTLTICLPFLKQERPTELAAKEGDGCLFQVFKREKEDVKQALVDADRKELSGSWQAVAYALGGKKAPDTAMKDISLVFYADGKTKAIRDGKVFIASTTKIDPTQIPATIDMTYSEGEGDLKGKTALGIYKIEGNLLTICRSAPGRPRPAEFSSNPGSGLTLMSYRKATRSQ